MFFLSVRKLKNQPNNKLLLAPFSIQTFKKGNIHERKPYKFTFSKAWSRT